MRRLIRRAAPLLLVTAALVGLFMVTPSKEVEASPFDTLLGSWRGSGTVQLNSGRERLSCNAYYTGGGNQLGMAIRCNSDSSTYNAEGSASGTATPGKISIRVSGSITGSMVVNFSRSSQSVSISTSGSPLQRVSIKLTRS
jgi:hypothetical protein